MKLVYYEFKKLCGIRYIWVLLAVMTAACAGLFYYTSDAGNADLGYSQVADAFFDEYEDDPERISEAYGVYLEYIDKLKDIDREVSEKLAEVGVSEDEKRKFLVWADAERERVTYTGTLGFSRGDGEPVKDERLFTELTSALAVDGEYRARIEKIIYNAEETIRFYEAVGAGDDPACEYGRHFAQKYGNVLKKTELSPTFVHGWREFFEYDEIGVFICLYMLVLAGAVFMCERSCGTLPIISIAKNGRAKVVAAKVVLVLLMSVFTAAVMTGAVALTCFLTFGFSSPLPPVQHVMAECPYVMSLGGYAAVMLFIRCAGAALFSCFAALVSSLFFSHIVTYASGVAFLAVNLLVNYLLVPSNFIPLNLVSVLWANGLLSSYAEVLLFGHFHSTLAAALVIYGALIAVASAAAVAVSRMAAATVKPPLRVGGLRLLREKKKRSRAIRPPRSLFAWEVRKIFTPVTAAVTAALLVFSVIEAQRTYSEYIMESDRIYEEYVSAHVFGEYSDASRDYLSERKTVLEEISSDERADEEKSKYLSGKIEFGEYRAFLSESGKAEAELGIVKKIMKHVTAMEKEGGPFWLFPNTMISRILGRDMNIFLYAAVVFLFSRICAADYASKSSEGAFASILRTTKRGRRESWRARTMAALAVSAGITAAFEAVDIIVGAAHTERFFDILGAPMLSIEKYAAFGGMTVGGYLLLVIAIRSLAHIMLALLTVAASFIVRRVSLALFVTAAVTLLPYALVYMGVAALRFADLTAALAGGKLLLRSAEFSVFGGTYTFAALFLLAFLCLTLSVTFYVRHKTEK